jgi:hypothetical protein
MIQKLLGSAEGILIIVAMTVVSMNVLMTSLKKIAERWVDKTEALKKTQVDNKILAFSSWGAGLTAKILEFASANSTKLPPKVREELEKQ